MLEKHLQRIILYVLMAFGIAIGLEMLMDEGLSLLPFSLPVALLITVIGTPIIEENVKIHFYKKLLTRDAFMLAILFTVLESVMYSALFGFVAMFNIDIFMTRLFFLGHIAFFLIWYEFGGVMGRGFAIVAHAGWNTIAWYYPGGIWNILFPLAIIVLVGYSSHLFTKHERILIDSSPSPVT